MTSDNISMKDCPHSISEINGPDWPPNCCGGSGKKVCYCNSCEKGCRLCEAGDHADDPDHQHYESRLLSDYFCPANFTQLWVLVERIARGEAHAFDAEAVLQGLEPSSYYQSSQRGIGNEEVVNPGCDCSKCLEDFKET